MDSIQLKFPAHFIKEPVTEPSPDYLTESANDERYTLYLKDPRQEFNDKGNLGRVFW